MKMTYSDLLAQFLRNIGNTGSTDTNLIADFQNHLGQRYQMMFAAMQDYETQQTQTANTVANQQYYHLPPGVVNIENIVITVGSVNYPLEVITAQRNWDLLNAIQIQASAIPQFYFPRRDDFGIWPVPQSVYLITFNYHIRDINLTVPDYTTGTVTVTNNSTKLTGVGTTFTSAMVGRMFQVTSATATGQGYWYAVSAFVSATELTLASYWEADTQSGLSYRVGQVPLVPDEGHITLCDGATADFYQGLRSDPAKATWWNNVYWTGDGNNNDRKEGDPMIKGGLIGLMNRWKDRNMTRIINRKPRLNPLNYQVWATTLST